MKIKNIKDLIAEYSGDLTLNQILEYELNKTPFKCPKCNGCGYVEERYNAYPSGMPDSGWVIDWKYRKVECDLCKGHGYTTTEYVPKMVQDGWQTKK